MHLSQRVVFFDYWTKGVHNFLRLMPYAPAGSAEFQLFHLGSWREGSVPRVQMIEGLPTVDIAAYRGMRLPDILRSLRPDVLVGLNMHTTFDRALFLTCRRLGIPTVYVQHGAIPDLEELRMMATQEDRAFGVKQYIQRVPKYLRLLPLYWRARKRSMFDSSYWQVLFSLVRRPSTSTWTPTEPEELWPDLALVFNHVWGDTLTKEWKLPAERVTVVGNPELDPAFERLASPLDQRLRRAMKEKLGLDADRPIVFYADEGLVDSQNFGWTRATMAKWMDELHAACMQAGLQMLVRPRPNSVQGFEQVWAGKPHVALTRELSLVDSVDLCSLAVGALSSVFETAIVLKKPLLTPLWHISGQKNLSPMLKYGASLPVESPEEFSGMLRAALEGRIRADTSRYMRDKIGGEGGNSCRRSMEAILELARTGPRAQETEK